MPQHHSTNLIFSRDSFTIDISEGASETCSLPLLPRLLDKRPEFVPGVFGALCQVFENPNVPLFEDGGGSRIPPDLISDVP